jgi:hypothetical protein
MALESDGVSMLLDLPGSVVRVGIMVEMRLLAKGAVVVREVLAVIGAKGHCRRNRLSTVACSLISRVTGQQGDGQQLVQNGHSAQQYHSQATWGAGRP